MTTILMVRHGENDYVKKGKLAGRLPGVHLNKRGGKQAQALAEFFVGKPVKAVYSSPLDRTMETALPIAKSLGLSVLPFDGLIEIDYGKWQDRKLKKLQDKKLWSVVQVAPSRMRFPGGESFAEGQQRVCQSLEKLAAQYGAGEGVICVSHSDVIKLAVAYYLGMPLDMFQRLHIAPASITALRLGRMQSSLLFMNYEISFSLPG